VTPSCRTRCATRPLRLVSASEPGAAATQRTPEMYAPAFTSLGEDFGNQRQPRSPYSRIFFHDAVAARGLEPSTE
jgi:hypothetical protein